MASSVGVGAEQPTSVEVFSWLRTLPVAPEYHPTLTEFQDPIAYIFKIEKEASKYGICKIVPPVSTPPKKTAISNLNDSLAARSASSDPKSVPTFTTRQQQVGFCPRKQRPVQKSVWQSGENYTLPQFEAKAKTFERNYLKKVAKKVLSPLEIETLYWKATVDKPFSVEYANDMPGSAFVPLGEKKSSKEAGEAVTVGETAWNMRGVSRANGSLLRFMKEEIHGVTSPMVYIAMMFSWFAWHAEDHDLHSLNYLHMGAGKTWYGVPREAAVAFEEVIRVHGFGGEINPLVTFATLGEKTTVMSPEVLISTGIPCCRLVQNAGEFVVTFPRAYHCGFSHGFNCGEAANIATPEWLRVAQDAATRRASINCPPMVSHVQLLYDLALSFCSRVPMSISPEPRSSRLKDKKKGEEETLVKELYLQDLMQNNELLHILGTGSAVIIFPQNSLEKSVRSNLIAKSELKVNPEPSFGLCSPDDKMKDRKSLMSDDDMLGRKQGFWQPMNVYSRKGRFSSLCDGRRLPLLNGSDDALRPLAPRSTNIERERAAQCDRSSDRGIFSCVTCGILCFACVAIIQPKEVTARYLMSADCSVFRDWDVSCGIANDGFTAVNVEANASELNICSGRMAKRAPDGLFDVPIQSADQVQTLNESRGVVSNAEVQQYPSALGLLAFTYGDISDSEEDQVEADIVVSPNETKTGDCSPDYRFDCDSTEMSSHSSPSGATVCHDLPFQRLVDCRDEPHIQIINSDEEHGCGRVDFEDQSHHTLDHDVEFKRDSLMESDSLGDRSRHQIKFPRVALDCSSLANEADTNIDDANLSFTPRSNEDSSRMRVFCLQHAAEVEQQLRPIGGVHIWLLCHPDYPKMEAEAKLLAGEVGADYVWNEIEFREATKEDKERIKWALDREEAIHGNGDWTAKLGINLYYSASLSRSPLYSKQMPYNSVIYKAFGCSSPANTPTKPRICGKGSGKFKKIVVAGKWCGKVWMSNQVHPLLAESDSEELEQERSFTVRTQSDVKPERQPENTSETASATSDTGKKRKNRVENRSVSVAKSPKTQNPVKVSNASLMHNFHQRQKRNLRNKRPRRENPQSWSKFERITRQFNSNVEDEREGGPSMRLRKRTSKPSKESKAKLVEARQVIKKQTSNTKAKKVPRMKASAGHNSMKIRNDEMDYPCDMEGCTMSFCSKQELVLHKRNICPVKGCGKKFFSHKYLVQHRRVHMDDRPLKCPWKGCKMTFKWAWARTEHIRVHTGARPYICSEIGCGQTFRFVSDFSRHKRKTGHSAKKGRG